MKDWGMLAEDFPEIKPMKAKKVSTPKKVSILAVKRNNPVKSPKKSRQHVAEHKLSSKEVESIQECNQKEEDQKEAEKLSKYLHDEFPDVLKEQLEKDDRMSVDPAELIMINEDVQPHYRGWAREVPAHYLDEAKQLIADLL